MEISKLLGKTLTKVSVNNAKDEIHFTDTDGIEYKMYHSQDCCESVTVEDIEGDLQDLVGSPITQAEENTNREDTFDKIEYPDSFTWTFYKLATVKGYVTIRWLGESNGYYSESVNFVEVGSKEDW